MPTKYVHQHAKTLHTCSARHTSWCTKNVHLILMLVMRTYAYEKRASACKNTAHLFLTVHLPVHGPVLGYTLHRTSAICERPVAYVIILMLVMRTYAYEICALAMQKHCTPVLYGTPPGSWPSTGPHSAPHKHHLWKACNTRQGAAQTLPPHHAPLGQLRRAHLGWLRVYNRMRFVCIYVSVRGCACMRVCALCVCVCMHVCVGCFQKHAWVGGYYGACAQQNTDAHEMHMRCTHAQAHKKKHTRYKYTQDIHIQYVHNKIQMHMRCTHAQAHKKKHTRYKYTHDIHIQYVHNKIQMHTRCTHAQAHKI